MRDDQSCLGQMALRQARGIAWPYMHLLFKITGACRLYYEGLDFYVMITYRIKWELLNDDEK